MGNKIGNKTIVIAVCLAVLLNANAAIAQGNGGGNGGGNGDNSCTGMTGAVWATRADLNRDTEVFNIGDDVYIAGSNFADQQENFLTGIVHWKITNQGAEGQPKPEIASGTANLQEANPYPFTLNTDKPAYITPKKIWTVDAAYIDLRLNVWHESWPTDCVKDAKFKTLKDTFSSEIPEFPTVALPVAAVIALMFLFQYRKRKED